ncbi:MAG: hypothetical protein GSR79_01450 [Desulfurococcales archaeon]|nr:hypothetical protein [Desulfurococcales archaeon]
MGVKITGEIIKEGILAILSIFLLGSSIYFFILSINLAVNQPPNITASLLAALIGFSVLSAGVTILKSWAIARAAEKIEA